MHATRLHRNTTQHHISICSQYNQYTLIKERKTSDSSFQKVEEGSLKGGGERYSGIRHCTNQHLRHRITPHNRLLSLCWLPCQHKQLRGEAQMAGVGVPEHQILFCLSELQSWLKRPKGANKTYC